MFEEDDIEPTPAFKKNTLKGAAKEAMDDDDEKKKEKEKTK